MRFSYAMLPDYPLSESLASIKKADELGFYAVYAADETWHKDLWLLFAAAAASTSRIRLGPSISGVCLREPTLIAQAAELRIPVRYLGIVPDDPRALDAALAEGLRSDVLLLTGGVSVGEHDLVKDALFRAGVREVLHGVAVKPGRPMLIGKGNDCLVAALPGNPVSAFTSFALFIAPALRRLMGYPRYEPLQIQARLTEPLRRFPARATYHLARFRWVGGQAEIEPVRTRGSGDVVSLIRANAFAVSDPGRASIPAGTSVPAVLWRDFDLVLAG